jgi:hypothetical protein
MPTALRVFCAYLIFGTIVLAGDPNTDTVKGLKGFRVFVEELGKANPPSLTTNALQTDIELRLRKAGVSVRAAEPFDVSVASLFVTVTCLQASPYDYACFTRVEVAQITRLARDPEIISVGSMTWTTGGLIDSGLPPHSLS